MKGFNENVSQAIDRLKVETILLDENVVIETYKKLGSYNKTTEALFGKGKRGTYYIEKIKPFIEKIDTKPNN